MDSGCSMTTEGSGIYLFIPDGIGKEKVIYALAQIAAAVESVGEASTPDVMLASVLITNSPEAFVAVNAERAREELDRSDDWTEIVEKKVLSGEKA